MKVTLQEVKPVFQPITVEVTFDSLRELTELRDYLGTGTTAFNLYTALDNHIKSLP